MDSKEREKERECVFVCNITILSVNCARKWTLLITVSISAMPVLCGRVVGVCVRASACGLSWLHRNAGQTKSTETGRYIARVSGTRTTSAEERKDAVQRKIRRRERSHAHRRGHTHTGRDTKSE